MLNLSCRFVFKRLLLIISLFALTACGGGNKDSDSEDAEEQTFSVAGSIVLPVGSDVDADVLTDFLSPLNNTFSNAQQINNPSFLGGYVSATSGTYSTSNNPSSPHTYSEDRTDIYQVSLLNGQRVALNVFFADNGLFASAEMNLNFSLFSSSNTANPVAQVNFLDQGSDHLVVPENDTYYIVLNTNSNDTVPLLYTLSISQSVATGPSTGQSAYVNPTAQFVPGEVIVKFKSEQHVDERAALAKSAASSGASSVAGTGQTIPQLRHKMHMGGKAQLMLLDLDEGQNVAASQASKNGVGQIQGLSQAQFKALPKSYRDKWNTAARINQLRKNPEIEYAEPNYIRQASYVPTDPQYPKQWHYPFINLPSAWNVATGAGVTVAVIDTGIASAHVDLDDNIDSANGWDFISNLESAADGDGPDNDPEDIAGSFHGSHVAGIIAAEEGNNLGVVGAAFDARIMALRVLGIDGFGTDSAISEAILYAAGLPNSSGTVPTEKADIINLSLGSDAFSSAMQSAVNAALAEGVIVIAAAGNDSTDQPFYPAAFDGVVSVSAVSETKALASFSNFGDTIDVAAPGGSGINDLNNDRYRDGILSTVYASFYEELQGTSMAAPHVAGVAALMKSVDPTLDNAKFSMALASGDITDNIGSSSNFGAGLINAAKALAWVGEPIATQLTVFPSSFSFVGSTTSSTFSLTNPGEGQVLVESVTENETWLALSEENVDSSKLGVYRLTVDRSGLAPGSNFATEITIQYRIDGGTLETQTIQVFLSVPTLEASATVGDVFVLLTRKADIDEAEESNAPFVDIFAVALARLNDGQYSFLFPDVPPGEYILDASTDNDNDFIVSEEGEAVGAYPVLSQPIVVTVSDQNLTGLDFSISYSLLSNSIAKTAVAESKPLLKKRPTKHSNLQKRSP
ncbi:MAG: S8 family serine peptidase [Oleiphilus sp.]